jgi:hypothetical protein
MGSKLAKNSIPLSISHPHLAKEWDYTKNCATPEDVSKGSHLNAYWTGACGHSWQQVVYNRTGLGSGCAICSGREILSGFNDLATLHPDLAKEWNTAKNGVPPSEASATSDKKVWWECSLGHEWLCPLNQKIKQGTKCPVCSNRITLTGFNDLATLDPKLAVQWDYSRNIDIPSEMNPKSTKKRWWKCTLNHSWEATVHSRHVAKTGCPFCSNKQLLTGYNDLASTAPLLAVEWHPTKNFILPTEVINGPMIKAWWICKDGHEWEALICHRVRQNTGCPYCTRQRVVSGQGDLATTHPHLLKEWNFSKNGILPSEIGFGSEKKVWWVCKEKHEWEAAIRNRVIGRNCPTCSNRVILPGFNDLATLNPKLALEWHLTKNDKPASAYGAGSAFRVWWICSKGHEWKAKIVNRHILHRGCARCSRVGTSKSEQAFHGEFKNVLTGINTDHTERVKLVGKDRALQLDIVGKFQGRKIAIEYDGIYFHSGEKKTKNDVENTLLLLKNGYIVVRIREDLLPFLAISHDNLLQISHRFSYVPQNVQATFRKILNWLELVV